MAFTEAQIAIDTKESQKETRLMKCKVKAVSNFALARNRLIHLLDEQDLPCRNDVKSACQNLDLSLETSMEVLDKLTELSIDNKQLAKAMEIVNQMENLLGEYSSAYDAAHHHSNSHYIRNTTQKGVAEVLHVQTREKQDQETLQQGTSRIEPEIRSVSTIEQDLWKQLKRIEIPVFNGDKKKYESWKAAFLACVDRAPATGEFKMLQLKQCLAGEALCAIEHLGHSAAAYDAAKERLERKFGGKRRQISLYYEEIDQFQQIRPNHSKDLERYADLLELLVIKLKEGGQLGELGNGSLYCKLQQKLPECMLARYHRWLFESGTEESVAALKTWVFHESEFLTVASETANGLRGDIEDTNDTEPRQKTTCDGQRTFFGEIVNIQRNENISCEVCGVSHTIYNCSKFERMSVPVRWETAKCLKLCYRCLANGHRGKSCENSRPCGRGGCRKLHNRLLHTNCKRTPREEPIARRPSLDRMDNSNHNCNSKPDVGSCDSGSNSADQNTSVMEGKCEGHRLDKRESGYGTCRMERHASEPSDRIDIEISLIPLEGNHTELFTR